MSGGTGYGDKAYWDKRYEEQKDKYDWYLGYDQIKEQLLPYLNVLPHTAAAGTDAKADTTAAATPATPATPADATSAATSAAPAATTTTPTTAVSTDARCRDALKVLIVGCGNSELSENFYDDGFTDNVSIDYSEVVIERMAAQFKTSGKTLKFEAMDVRDLKYPSETFDFIVDKGTLDAILCGSDSAKNAGQMLTECQRVLKKGGFFFIITYGQPQSRLNYLEKSRYKWKVSYQNLGKTRYMYVMENTDPVRSGATPYDD